MHGSILHVYNFRGMPQSGIHIGQSSLIGEHNVIRGQGGVQIGDRVFTSPFVQIVAVNHVFDDPNRPFAEQGITAQGIVIEDDVWIGSGAVITDGVRIGKGAVVAPLVPGAARWSRHRGNDGHGGILPDRRADFANEARHHVATPAQEGG